MSKSFQVGDRVVFTRDKHTTKPGPRAKNVVATPHGEMYEYQVDKYWRVVGIQADGQLIFKTRRGKQHVFPASDPRLRKASLWERLFKSKLFPTCHDEEIAPSEGTKNAERLKAVAGRSGS
jgi:hypothetical protein